MQEGHINHEKIKRLTTHPTSTIRQQNNTTDIQIIQVFLCSCQVQALQVWGENFHDFGSRFTDIGILYQVVSPKSEVL